jgi:Na+/proline symporter
MKTILPEVKSDSGYRGLFLNWIAGIVLIYSVLFGFGKLILGEHIQGVVCLIVALLAAGVIYWDLSKRGFEKVVE